VQDPRDREGDRSARDASAGSEAEGQVSVFHTLAPGPEPEKPMTSREKALRDAALAAKALEGAASELVTAITVLASELRMAKQEFVGAAEKARRNRR
jgi:hypothetical protein